MVASHTRFKLLPSIHAKRPQNWTSCEKKTCFVESIYVITKHISREPIPPTIEEKASVYLFKKMKIYSSTRPCSTHFNFPATIPATIVVSETLSLLKQLPIYILYFRIPLKHVLHQFNHEHCLLLFKIFTHSKTEHALQ
jgi:hypothetical protein